MRRTYRPSRVLPVLTWSVAALVFIVWPLLALLAILP